MAILLVLCVVVVTTVGFGIWKISGMLFHDPYETHRAYETKGRDHGDTQQINKEYENETFVSFTHPTHEEKELNSLVKVYEKKTVLAADKTKKQIISTDYDSSLPFDRYADLVFHRYIYNVDGVQTCTETTWMLYDKKQEKQLVLEDILCRGYPALVKRLTGEQGRKKDIKCNASALSMTKTSLYTHLDEKHTVSILYKEYGKYMRLKGSHIPSLYQKSTAVARAQPKVDPKKKMIASTLDDGPSAYTSEAMDIFKRYDGRAILFMPGQNVEANRDTVKETYNRDFELGNHSRDHSMDLVASKKGYVSVPQVTENTYKV